MCIFCPAGQALPVLLKMVIPSSLSSSLTELVSEGYDTYSISDALFNDPVSEMVITYLSCKIVIGQILLSERDIGSSVKYWDYTFIYIFS
jgi:hypothetical protein